MTSVEKIASAVPSIDLDEMSFALALFVGAARGRVTPPETVSSEFALVERPAARSDLPLADEQQNPPGSAEPPHDENPLVCAVSLVWHHYEGDTRRQAICSRLVAFYSLMVRTRGAVLDRGVTPSEDDPATVLLDPAVVGTVATAPLNESGQFNDLAFRNLVKVAIDREGPAGSSLLSVPRLPVKATIPITEIVQQLAELLFACEQTIAVSSEPAGPQRFRVLERLCEPFASVSGNQSLQAILSRALIATSADFPWLSSARVMSGRYLEMTELRLSRQEAVRGELALMGSLVELLRSVLGDTVTLQLLQTVWPLASLDRKLPEATPLS